MRWILVAAALLSGCSADSDNSESGPDAGVGDPMDDAGDLGCVRDELVVWFADADGDGFGDEANKMMACAQPAGFTDNGGDCNDSDPAINPDSAELCDGIDNDCEPATTEVCPSQCSPRTLDSRLYLFCAEATPWADALAVCAAQQMLLVRVDDQAELTQLVAARVEAFGGAPETWIGANDMSGEGQWRWADSDQFWQGNNNGSAVGGLFSRWRGSQPDNANSNPSVDENCAIIESGGQDWDDKQCPQSRRFICETVDPPTLD